VDAHDRCPVNREASRPPPVRRSPPA
jgi:hypothetical protein